VDPEDVRPRWIFQVVVDTGTGFWVIPKPTEDLVAVRVEKPSDYSGLVVVVDAEALRPTVASAADVTDTVLVIIQHPVHRGRKSVGLPDMGSPASF